MVPDADQARIILPQFRRYPETSPVDQAVAKPEGIEHLQTTGAQAGPMAAIRQAPSRRLR
jgi:hypothetical protein